MRYQRVSPDSFPLSNGRRSNSKEDEHAVREINGKTIPNFQRNGLPRFRSPSKTQDHNSSHFSVHNSPPPPPMENNHQTHESNSSSFNGGDMLLQWGHRKRSRCSRTESRVVVGVTTDDSSSSSLQFPARQRQPIKVQRRSVAVAHPNPAPAGGDKASTTTITTTITATNTMPPPSLPSTNGRGGGGNLKPCTKNISVPFPNRKNLEERSGTGNESPLIIRTVSSRSKVGKRSPSVAEKFDRSRLQVERPGSARDDKFNGCPLNIQEAPVNNMNLIDSAPPEEEAGFGITNNDDNNTNNGKTVRGGGEKVNGDGGGGCEVNEWPRIYIPLTRKEKEEDFLAMKGTKLPHRPKKRPKTVDRVLQFCFPGMWLSDLTKGRYEVREKKCPKKQKRKGLKGMETMDSDTE